MDPVDAGAVKYDMGEREEEIQSSPMVPYWGNRKLVSCLHRFYKIDNLSKPECKEPGI